jgi:hypothetical protein
LDDQGTIHVDDGEQTGTNRKYGVVGIFYATIRQKRSGSEIEGEKLCEFLDTEWAGSHRNTLEETVRVFPICLVENL